MFASYDLILIMAPRTHSKLLCCSLNIANYLSFQLGGKKRNLISSEVQELLKQAPFPPHFSVLPLADDVFNCWYFVLDV